MKQPKIPVGVLWWPEELHLLAVSMLGSGIDLRLSAAAGLTLTLFDEGSMPVAGPDSELRLCEGIPSSFDQIPPKNSGLQLSCFSLSRAKI